MNVTIEPHGSNCLIKISPIDAINYQKLWALPGYKVRKDSSTDFIFRPTANNIRHIHDNWPEAQWINGASAFLDVFIREMQEAEATLALKKSEDLKDDGSYLYKTDPFDHQRKCFLLSRDKPEFAYFMEQGTGKSKVGIDTAAYLYSGGKIDTVIIFAPNGVHSNWIETEIPTHLPDWCPRELWTYKSSMTKANLKKFDDILSKQYCLRIFSFNIEGIISEKAAALIRRIMACGKVLVIVDESQYIKNHSAKRTKIATKLCESAPYKRIGTGTSVTKGVQDLYAQFSFLSKDILGFDSFYTFRNHFCTMGGFEMKQIVGYKNLDELTKLIDPYSFRVLKTECLDLPPKLYKRWVVDLTPKQRDLYNSLKDAFYAELEGHGTITANLAIVRLLRLQQITCGWFPNDEMIPIPGDNPKLEAVKQHCLDTDGAVIVWARFKADIKNITEELRRDHGRDNVASYFGETEVEERTRIVDRFQKNDLKIIVAHAKAAGRGLTLTACSNPIYHSNDFDLELRLQSEDRTHRIGTKESVTYTDVEAKRTIDKKIISSLRKKKNIADIINNDPKSLFIEEESDVQ